MCHAFGLHESYIMVDIGLVCMRIKKVDMSNLDENKKIGSFCLHENKKKVGIVLLFTNGKGRRG